MYILQTIITIYQKYISLVNKVINFRPGLFVLASDPMYGLKVTVAVILVLNWTRRNVGIHKTNLH